MDNKIIKSKEGVVSLKKYTKFDLVLLPVIQNLIAEGYSEADVGIIIGYSGKGARNWLKGLKKRNEDVRAICEVGKHQANLKLVSKAFQLATEGYDYVEVIDEGLVITNKDGSESALNKFKRKVKRKHIAPDRNLLWNLLCSRLPEYFGNSKQGKKKDFLGGDIEEQIADMFGDLSKNRTKKIEATVIEAE